MHVFDYSFLENVAIPNEIASITSTISAFNAISNERKNKYEESYKDLIKLAIVQSVKCSNAIEGIITTDARINEIVLANSTPLNHNEEEIAGYRDALYLIHTSFNHLSFNEETIINLHNMLYKLSTSPKYSGYKTEDNLILEIGSDGRRSVRFVPVKASEVNDAMNQLILAYIDARDNPSISDLLLIPCVILDFLCIHPFTDGNGRVSRLLTLLLLYKNQFDIAKYVSFEQQINEQKGSYYDALQESSIDWHENKNTYFPFIKNFLYTMYKCYQELDNRFLTINSKKLSKSERIEMTVLNSVLPISKSDLCHILEDVSQTTIESVLGKMVKNGSIKMIGNARSTKYVNSKYIK